MSALTRLDVGRIIDIVRTATAMTPEFVALIGAVSGALSTRDQAELAQALEAALVRAKAAHDELQATLAELTSATSPAAR